MASKKHKSAKDHAKSVHDDSPRQDNGQSVEISALTHESVSDTRWIMREAAWVRMFGRVEAKNPFTR